MRISLATLGCKVNQYDTAALAEILRQDGHTVVSYPSPAEAYIVNTCTVTGKTDDQSRQLIRRIHRSDPRAPIVVTGCYAQMNPGDLEALEGVSLVLGNGEKPRIGRWIRGLTEKAGTVHVEDAEKEKTCFAPAVPGLPGRTRAFLKIQDGCNAFCRYCIVPLARGRSRSLPPAEVLDRLALFSRNDCHEVVLTGIHLGTYGEDRTPGTTLLDLLRLIEDKGSVKRLRLSSIEPMEVTGEFIEFWKKSAVLCRHAHIPLQSGSDAVLRKMGRPYDRAFFRSLVLSLVEAMPDMAVGTDVMVGFPGEEEADFQATLSLLRDLPLAYLHVFPYSKRPGTAAFPMDGHLPGQVKKKRVAALREQSADMRAAFGRKFIGKTLSVLVEGKKDRRTGWVRGFSENYIPCLIPEGGQALANRIVPMVPREENGGVLIGNIAPAVE